MNLEHYYTTDFGTYRVEPAQFAAHMTEAAKRRGDAALNDRRYKVAKAIKAWAKEQDMKALGL